LNIEWLDSLWHGLLDAHPLRGTFELPVIFDLGAVFFFALTISSACSSWHS
jgi:hypothetical protein